MILHDASLRIIRANQAPSGAYIASPTFSQYGYCWLRDGTWTAYAMDIAGDHASAGRFYRWVGRTLAGQQVRLDRLLGKLARGETPADDDYLPTRFTLDGDLGDDFWWDFQLDGYGAWLWGLGAHLDLTGDQDLWAELLPAVKLTIRYLAALWDAPNYDCWEEARDRIHISTLAAVYGGLCSVEARAAELVPTGLTTQLRRFALEHGITGNGHLRKHFDTVTVDASLLWTAVPYALVDLHDPIFAHTLARVETGPPPARRRRVPLRGRYLLRRRGVAAAGGLAGLGLRDTGSAGRKPARCGPGSPTRPPQTARWRSRLTRTCWTPAATPNGKPVGARQPVRLLWSHAMFLILESALEKAS